ncbi:hypothetical protein [Arthrobacter sp. NicSoilB8]|uniref:hypothetical protein n=1 Tax=Arthrobacter sp. NicSoilB8 TaxID=2830998 RepID=UPI001CC43F0F|nr:hypothetical protein [Arthrobacter sp. NicSoilB8]
MDFELTWPAGKGSYLVGFLAGSAELGTPGYGALNLLATWAAAVRSETRLKTNDTPAHRPTVTPNEPSRQQCRSGSLPTHC